MSGTFGVNSLEQSVILPPSYPTYPGTPGSFGGRMLPSGFWVAFEGMTTS